MLFSGYDISAEQQHKQKEERNYEISADFEFISGSGRCPITSCSSSSAPPTRSVGPAKVALRSFRLFRRLSATVVIRRRWRRLPMALRKCGQLTIGFFTDALENVPARCSELNNSAFAFTLAGRNGFRRRFHAPFGRFRRPIRFFCV